MKTKFYWVALLASAAMIAQANAGGHHGGGGGHSDASAPARSSNASSFHSAPARNFGGGRMIHSGRHFSPAGMRQFYRGGINRDRFGRFGNNTHVVQSRNNSERHNSAIARHRNGAGQIASGNSLPRNWQNHVAARHTGSWHRDWDRSRDHSWHGHHCRFINGSWVIFDLGFYPWSFGYPYGSDYGYGYYPYGYDPGYYYSDYDDGDYYGQNAYDSSDAYAGSAVAAAQERLAREGYYRGEIDGIFGPQTRHAIARYQSSRDLEVTGNLTPDTLDALGLPVEAND